MYEYLGQQPALGVYGRHIRPIELKPYLKESKFNTFFKFAFVRNPWDWHVSAYHYNLNDSNAVWHSIIKKKSFEEYLYWVIDNIEKVGAAQYDFLSDGMIQEKDFRERLPWRTARQDPRSRYSRRRLPSPRGHHHSAQRRRSAIVRQL